MFHLLAYTGNAGIAAVNFDLTAAFDAEFSQRNGHYIFTERYKLINAIYLGTSITAIATICPTWNAIGRMQSGLTQGVGAPASNSYTDLKLGFEAQLPVNEEVQVQMSNSAGAAAQNTAVLFVATMQHSNKLPMPAPPGINIRVAVSCSVTAVANAWAGPAPITFAQSLRGGVYSVVGMDGGSATLVASRLVFPRNPLYNGRRLRPGCILDTPFTNSPPQYGVSQARLFGEFGRFHTFEPPQIEVFANAAGAINPSYLLDLVYLGDYDDPLQGFTAA